MPPLEACALGSAHAAAGAKGLATTRRRVAENGSRPLDLLAALSHTAAREGLERGIGARLYAVELSCHAHSACRARPLRDVTAVASPGSAHGRRRAVASAPPRVRARARRPCAEAAGGRGVHDRNIERGRFGAQHASFPCRPHRPCPWLTQWKPMEASGVRAVESIAAVTYSVPESIVRKSCKSLASVRARNFHEVPACECVGGVHRTHSGS
jgi:hypothetical protein